MSRWQGGVCGREYSLHWGRGLGKGHAPFPKNFRNFDLEMTFFGALSMVFWQKCECNARWLSWHSDKINFYLRYVTCYIQANIFAQCIFTEINCRGNIQCTLTFNIAILDDAVAFSRTASRGTLYKCASMPASGPVPFPYPIPPFFLFPSSLLLSGLRLLNPAMGPRAEL